MKKFINKNLKKIHYFAGILFFFMAGFYTLATLLFFVFTNLALETLYGKGLQQWVFDLLPIIVWIKPIMFIWWGNYAIQESLKLKN